MPRVKSILICVALLMPCVSGAPAVDDEPDFEGAEAAAKQYITRLKTGQVRQAVRDHWDAHEFMSASFGIAYLSLSDEEKLRARNAFADFAAMPFSNEHLMALFKTLQIAGTRSRQVSESEIIVTLEIVADAGRFRRSDNLLLRKGAAGWRITDQGEGSKGSLRASMAATYMLFPKRPGDTIGSVLDQATAELRKRAPASPSTRPTP